MDKLYSSQCVLALSDSQMGIIVLPTVLYLAKILAKLAMGLDRRPELIAHVLQKEAEADREGVTEKITLVEKSANVVREAFIKCLTDRSSTTGMHGKPEGKRVGIYLMANLCLKLIFQVCASSDQAPKLLVANIITMIVRQASKCGANVCQYKRPVPATIILPSFPKGNLPILPRTIPLLEQSLLPRANGLTDRL